MQICKFAHKQIYTPHCGHLLCHLLVDTPHCGLCHLLCGHATLWPARLSTLANSQIPSNTGASCSCKMLGSFMMNILHARSVARNIHPSQKALSRGRWREAWLETRRKQCTLWLNTFSRAQKRDAGRTMHVAKLANIELMGGLDSTIGSHLGMEWRVHHPW